MQMHRLHFVLAAHLSLTLGLACSGTLAVSRQAENAAVFERLVGEVEWGQTFAKPLGRGFVFKLQLLGSAEDSQNGLYVSILNPRNPKGHEFVLLSELVNGAESNFVGVFVQEQDKPEDVAQKLRAALDRCRERGLNLRFFTDNLPLENLERVEAASETLGHHGLEEEEYKRAEDVLGSLHTVVGSFKILDYRLTANPDHKDRPIRIGYLKFSFAPSAR